MPVPLNREILIPSTTSQADDWEGKKVSSIYIRGAQKHNGASVVAMSGIQLGDILTKKKRDDAVSQLVLSHLFSDVRIEAFSDAQERDRITVTIRVVEK